MDEQVVATNPSDARDHPHVLMGNMGFLVLPVYQLGGRKGQRMVALLLDFASQEIRRHVQPVIDLSVVVEIEGGRPVRKGIEHALGDRKPEGNRSCICIGCEAGETQDFLSIKRKIGHTNYIDIECRE